MREQRKALSLFLALALLLNLFLPISLVAAEEAGGHDSGDCLSVQDLVYGEPSDPYEPCNDSDKEEGSIGGLAGLLGGIGLMNMGQKITDNLIESVEIWTHPDELGNPTDESEKISDVRPNPDERVAVQYRWKLPDNHTYRAEDYCTKPKP